ncbi:NADP-dependent oxidoreductase [Pseudomaricurvus alcaniphilus]|uniref:NADP-dependent oxidoreductase n=1 Tax=Pseudomaricurvus alcaniphilus TaxID=1166482 RepID=UPI00140B72B0|nr:NADP-dependent oxidoreductase [Pseudomaricurvus alcaniphilus]NHN39215.1 NADP-dependent oxidoreductase [Pseudomaricurvus alcaniphilus]
MLKNRQITLASHAHGVPQVDNFSMIETPVPTPGAGQFLIRNLYFSLEPAIRGWLEGKANYFEPIPLGGVVRGPSVGRVIESNNPDYAVGDIVFALNQWEDYSICNADTILLEKLQPQDDTPLSWYVGPLGGSGTTAYVGLHEIGHIKAGQTVVVSAAAGATGSMVGQIAKQRGCRVIGIVGSDAKAQMLVDDFGFDGAINYNTCTDITAAVMAQAPDGVDIYFDNVGGPILNAMLLTMKVQGRIVCCGMISDYNRTENPNPITNLWEVVARQLTMQGFLLFTYHDQVPAAQAQLAEWITSGKIKVLEHITKGIANTPAAFCELMSGKTTGKALVQLDLPEEQ